MHFPIVLLLLGAPLGVAAVFFRGGNLPLFAAAVLTLGAVGAVAATWSGGQAAELAGELAGSSERVLDEHEEWGERARNAGIMAAALALGSAALFRMRTAARVVGAAAALASVAAAFSVAQAGHYGGQVVYKHGVGVNAAAGVAPSVEDGRGKAKETKQRHDDKD